MYADEVVAGQRKVASMREANADAHDVTQQVRVRATARGRTRMSGLYFYSRTSCRVRTRRKGTNTNDLSFCPAKENVLRESEMMVQDNATRLEDAYNALTVTSERFAHDGLVKASSEYEAAAALLKEVEAALKR